MKVLVKNYEEGFKMIAKLDEDYLFRQNKIIEMYRMLIGLYRLTSTRKDSMIMEKAR
jgi:hypothetical protein